MGSGPVPPWTLGTQVQAFIPTPMTLATAMYWTGLNPMSMKPLFVAKEWKDRKIQQALLQPHKPEHREILREYERDKRKPLSKAVSPRDANGKRFRSVVEAPKSKLGQKLLLDSR